MIIIESSAALFNMSGENGIESYRQDDYNKALAKLRQISPLQPGYGVLVGYSQEGRTIWFPRSYLAGYMSILNNTQLTITTDWGVVGQLSDGSWAFLPSFKDGREKALHDLRMAAMAQAHLRTFEEIETMKKERREERELAAREKEELRKLIDSLHGEISKIKQDKENKEKGDTKKS